MPSLLTIVAPQPVYAVQANPKDQLERWLYYRGMRACLEKPDWSKTDGVAGVDDQDGSRSREEINKGHLFSSNPVYLNSKEGFGYLGKDMDNDDSNDGTVNCSDGNVFVDGSKAFGFPSVLHMICAMNKAASELGMGNKIDPEGDAGVCVDASRMRFHHVEDSGDAFQRMLTKALENPIAAEYGGDGDRPSFHFNDNNGDGYTYKSLLYLLGKNSLETFCGGGLSSANANDSYDGDDKAVSVYIVEGGAIKESGFGEEGFSHSYAVTKKDKEGDTVNDVYYSNGGNDNAADDRSCADMARWTREGARDYLAWARENDTEAEQNESGGDTTTDPEEAESSCTIDGIGWIVCPVFYFIADLNDKAFEALQNILTIRPALLLDGETRQAWGSFRNIANALFVMAALIIIYSQMTGSVLSNYGVKRMLPRLVIAAILVNASFWICAAAVDISNIVGTSLKDFLAGATGAGGAGIGGSDPTTWDKIVGWVLAGTLILALIAVVITAPMVLLAFAVVLLILIARQAIVLLLVVVAPVAFVAWLLPNTEQWFQRWWKLFFAMLVLFPMIALLFGASELASNVLMGIASNGGNLSENSGDDEILLGVVALGVMAVPLFAVPAMLKGALAATGAIGAKVSSWSDRADRAAGGQAKKRADNSAFMRGRKLRQQGKQAYRDRRFAEGVSGSDTSLLGRARRRSARGVTNGHAVTEAGRQSQQYMERAATGATNKADAEQVSFASRNLSDEASASGDATAHLSRRLRTAIDEGDHVTARAAINELKQQGDGGVAAIQQHLEETNGGSIQQQLRQHIGDNHSDLKGKDARITNWLGDGSQSALSTPSMAGLTDAQLASQTQHALHDAASTGAIDATRAQNILDAARAGRIEMKDNKRAYFESIVNGTPLPPRPPVS